MPPRGRSRAPWSAAELNGAPVCGSAPRASRQRGVLGGWKEPSVHHFHATIHECSSAQPAPLPSTACWTGARVTNLQHSQESRSPLCPIYIPSVSPCLQGEGQGTPVLGAPGWDPLHHASSLLVHAHPRSTLSQGWQNHHRQAGSQRVKVPCYSFHTWAPLICRLNFPEAKAFY